MYKWWLVFLVLLGCGEHPGGGLISNVGDILSRTGRLPDADLSDIPQDIEYDIDVSSLPDYVSLESKFPPIGDQGNYGTCVAWAAGYNLKTALNSIDENWSALDLENAANQTSPKDLWMTIPSKEKGTKCEGTDFKPAFNAMISKGVASLAKSPYENMGTCSGTSNGEANNKLANYRMISCNRNLYRGCRSTFGMDANLFKSYLARGIPIAIGAKLGDLFIEWKNSAAISYDTYNGRETKRGAFHAMVLTGYDDSRNAFRVRNSWSSRWGDEGSIWVDYDFFVKNFCTDAYIAQNPAPQFGYMQKTSDYDLLINFAEDIANPDGKNARERILTYETINGSSALYMFYNAYNINESGILFEGYSGKAKYTMPNITGDYYLALLAGNSFYFITAENGKPLKFSDGLMLSEPMKPLAAALASSVAQLGEPNAYTPQEIKKTLSKLF